jgi:N-acetylglucosamine-6-sulfatase
VLNIDICPSFLDAAGAGPGKDLHGASLLPLLRGETAGWRRDFLYEYFWDWEALHTPTVLGLRTERYSYMEYQGIWDINELYDIQADPHQVRNLIGDAAVRTEAGGLIRRIADPAVRELVTGLRKRMNQILSETNGRFYPAWRARG